MAANPEELAHQDLGPNPRPELVKAWIGGWKGQTRRVSVDLTPDLYEDLTNLAASLSREWGQRVSLAATVRNLIRGATASHTENTR